LFVERAVQANFRFAITDDNAPTVVEICRRLDGLPLAIELAALRTRVLTPGKILDRLVNRLQFLSGGARDLPARQQKMRDAIAWSFDLLTEGEKSLFRQLAIFAGGFTIEAAERVAGETEESLRKRAEKQIGSVARPFITTPSSQTEVLDLITSLTDKGLLVSSDGPDGNPRIRMLEVVREFALESLENIGHADAVRRRHAEYYTTLGEMAEPHLLTSNAGYWLNSLEREHLNLRSAIRWLFENDPLRAARLAAAIRVYLFVRSHLTEGREWLETALQRNKRLPEDVRFNLKNNLGVFALSRRDYEVARGTFEENLSEATISGNKTRIADSLRGLASAASSQRDYATAQKYYEKALRIYRQSDDVLGIARSLLGLGVLAFSQQEVERAQKLLEESLMTYRKIGYKSGICTCLNALGEFAYYAEDFKSALKYFNEAFTIAVSESYRDRLSFCFNGFAALAAQQKNWKKAAQLTGAAEKLRETIGYRPEPQDDDFRNSYIERPRAILGPDSFSAAYEEGREMKIEEVIGLSAGTCDTRDKLEA